MMKRTVVGVSGLPGTGKDTLADVLVAEFGFTKAAFADAVYVEIAAAFEVSVATLRARHTKERAMPFLDIDFCTDREFAALASKIAVMDNGCLSPRMTLRLWATEYRRARKGDNYWVDQLEQTIRTRPGPVVVTDVRFENEAELVRSYSEPRLIHLRREGVTIDKHQHSSDGGVKVHDGDFYLSNDGDVEAYQHAVLDWARRNLP